MSCAVPRPLSKKTIGLLRFQRYLTRYYPITSAMSYQIGKYVATNLLQENFRSAKVAHFHK